MKFQHHSTSGSQNMVGINSVTNGRMNEPTRIIIVTPNFVEYVGIVMSLTPSFPLRHAQFSTLYRASVKECDKVESY